MSLTSLQFDMPAGISRFELCAVDPDIESDVKGVWPLWIRSHSANSRPHWVASLISSKHST